MAVIAPTQPLNLQVVPDNQALMVSWDPPLNTGGGAIRSYRVITGSFRPGPQPPCETVTPTSCRVTGLLNGVHYDVAVEAVNSGGLRLRGPESEPAIGIPNARPSGPRDFQLLSAGSTTATLAWLTPQHTGPDPILGYTISIFNNEGYWYPNQAPEYPQISVGPDVRQYRVTGLKPGLAYQFAVQAYTRLAPGAMTVNVLHNPLGLPGKPAMVTVAGVGNTTASLEWEDADPNGGIEPTHYRLTATPLNPPVGVLTEVIVCPVKASQDAPDFPAFAAPEGPPPPPLVDSATVLSPTSIEVIWLPSVTAGGPDVGAVTYTVTLNGDPVCRNITATTCTLVNLIPSQDYDLAVMAINEVFGGDVPYRIGCRRDIGNECSGEADSDADSGRASSSIRPNVDPGRCAALVGGKSGYRVHDEESRRSAPVAVRQEWPHD